MTEKEAMCSFVRYESGVEGGMISLSEMRAFLNSQGYISMEKGTHATSKQIYGAC